MDFDNGNHLDQVKAQAEKLAVEELETRRKGALAELKKLPILLPNRDYTWKTSDCENAELIEGAIVDPNSHFAHGYSVSLGSLMKILSHFMEIKPEDLE